MTTRQNFKAAAAKIEAMAADFQRTVPSGLRIIGEEILTDVKSSRAGAGVPKDTGALASTGQVTGPDDRGSVSISFGGVAAAYALVQHEKLSYIHPLGEARYLVRGVERWQSNGASVQKALKLMLLPVSRAKTR